MRRGGPSVGVRAQISNRIALMGQFLTLYDVRSKQRVDIRLDLSPERPLPVGHVSDRRPLLNVQVESLGEEFRVVPDVCGEH